MGEDLKAVRVKFSTLSLNVFALSVIVRNRQSYSDIELKKHDLVCPWTRPGNPYFKGYLSTIDLYIYTACFVKKKLALKEVDLNMLAQGGQSY